MGKRSQHRYTNAATRRQNVTSQEHFARIPSVRHQRSKFDRSHGIKTTLNAGDLCPVFVDEALPGDTFSLSASIFGRLATPIFPVMENLYLDWFFFAVPYRLVWENWQRFNGEQHTPGDSIDYEIPQCVSDGGVGFLPSTVMDYMGLPVGVPNISVSSLHFRAYNLIWNEWFRDENLQDPAVVAIDDGPDQPGDFGIRKRGKRHDYFTSSLPWPQKGPAVEIPLGTQAPLVGLGPVQPSGDGVPTFRYQGDTQPMITNFEVWQGQSADAKYDQASEEPNTPQESLHWEAPKLDADLSTGYADLTSATAVTINALREAFQVQRMYEKDARGGTRYMEILRSHFGVISPDARLQRPEFIGGGKTIVTINPVAQTSETDPAATPKGDLSAYGTTFGTPVKFTQSFTEHSLVIGICSLRADLNYQQGINRMWSRKRRFDFYWPSFAHLGEQGVLNQEIYAQGSADPAADAAFFGYQERYAEYRYKPSQITNQMRSTVQQPLDAWHLAQHFGSLPVLNGQFIEEDPPMERIKAVTTEHDLLLDGHFKLICSRPMPTYSTPGMIDHF